MHGDVVAVARVLLALPGDSRRTRCESMIRQSHAAHQYFKRFGHSHPRWGDGSLMSIAHRFPMRPEPSFSDSEYCRCVKQVLGCLLEWRLSRRRS